MRIAIIPARGGSKRIPRKNIRFFAGRPMIGYSIDAAAAAGLFERIIVSTDDAEIAQIARDLNAEVPFERPPELANDYAGTSAVVRHVLEWARGVGMNVKFVCCIYATAPFIRAEYIRKGYEELKSSGKAYAFSIARFQSPIQRAIRITQSGTIEPFFPEHVRARSQDLEQAYHDAGQFYWGTSEAFLNDIPVFSPASVPVILPSQLVLDIDTPEDWVKAELMYEAMKNRDG